VHAEHVAHVTRDTGLRVSLAGRRSLGNRRGPAVEDLARAGSERASAHAVHAEHVAHVTRDTGLRVLSSELESSRARTQRRQARRLRRSSSNKRGTSAWIGAGSVEFGARSYQGADV
jgi:hypothetical protein